MSLPPEGEHTLKGVTENQYLPPLQKQILLYLAERQPQSKYKISKGLKGYYKSVYDAIDELAKKKLLAEINEEEYRNQTHSVYWLTSTGTFIALVQRVNSKTLLNRTNEIIPDDKMLQYLIELSAILGTEMYKVGYQAILKNGRLEKSDISQMMTVQLVKEMSFEQLKQIIEITKKYPEQYGNLKAQIDEMIEKMKKAELFFKDAFEDKMV
jgi:hypothetical protein